MRLLLVGLVTTLVLGSPAWGRSVAVLPFDAGAKSDAYDGLGRALAGMLVSDLSKAPGVELVERERLDALLSEIDLGEGGFVDPATAARLGKGVGAEWVVLGSFSVVGEQFLLDGRAVDVASGKVITASDAQGTVADFVTVEKELVEELLEGLQVALTAGVRRQILSDAPTEDFKAVASYGAGLQAEFEGQLEEARKKFEEATQRDPTFDLPQQRIAALRTRLEELERERQAGQKDQRTRDLEGALAKTPTEMDQKGPTKTDDERARYAIRFALLEVLGRRCEQSTELAHYLERHKGQLADTGKHPVPYNARITAAHALGLVGKPYVWDHGVLHTPPGGYEHLVVFDTPNLGWPGDFLIGIADGPDEAQRLGGSLLNAAIACAGNEPGARVKAVQDVKAQVERFGLGSGMTSVNGHMPVHVQVDLMLLWALAQRDGMTAEVEAGVNRLLALDLPSDEQFSVRSDTSKIANAAAARDKRVAAMRGRTPDEVLAIQRGWVAKDPKVFRLDRPECAVFFEERQTEWRARTLERLEKDFGGGIPDAKGWGAVVSAVEDQAVPEIMGCLADRDGVLGNLAEVVAWLETADRRALPARDAKVCDPALAELRQSAQSYVAIPNSPPGLYTSILVQQAHARLIRPGCVSLR